MRCFVVALLIFPLVIWGQSSYDGIDSCLPKTQKVMGFVPSEANVINGWAIGYGFTLDAPDLSTQTINGLYTNVQPITWVCFSLFDIEADFTAVYFLGCI